MKMRQQQQQWSDTNNVLMVGVWTAAAQGAQHGAGIKFPKTH